MSSSLTVTTVGRAPLVGKRLTLELARPSHAEFLHDCYSNDGFMDYYRLAQDRNLTVDQIRERLETDQKFDPKQLRKIEWVVNRRHSDSENLEPIGIAALADYHAVHNRAEFLLGIVNTDNRAGGAGLEAALLVLEFAFHKARLHKIVSLVYGYNDKAQSNTLHLGFQQEGKLRDHYFNYKERSFVDLYQNAMLVSDFQTNKSLSRLSKRLLGRDITDIPPANRVKAIPKEKLEEARQKILGFCR